MLALFLSFIIVLTSGYVFYSKSVLSKLLRIRIIRKYPHIITGFFQFYALGIFYLANRWAWNVGISELGLGWSHLVIAICSAVIIALSVVLSVWNFVVRPNPDVRLKL